MWQTDEEFDSRTRLVFITGFEMASETTLQQQQKNILKYIFKECQTLVPAQPGDFTVKNTTDSMQLLMTSFRKSSN